MKNYNALLLSLALIYGGTEAATRKTVAKKTRSEAVTNAKKAKKEAVEDNVFQLAQDTKELSTFVELVELAKLKDTLETSKNVTLFAPTNKAFKQFKEDNPELFEDLDKAAQRKKLAEVLKYHMISTQKLAKDLKNDASVATKLTLGNGDRTRKRLTISKTGTETTLIGDKGGATIIKADIIGGNGVIQLVDDVLVPDAAPEIKKVAQK